MTKKQKIGMKEYEGKAFIGEPAKIQFKDFDVGKPRQLILKLTNGSNAFNSFNVLPLPPKIRVCHFLFRIILKLLIPQKEKYLRAFLAISNLNFYPN